MFPSTKPRTSDEIQNMTKFVVGVVVVVNVVVVVVVVVVLKIAFLALWIGTFGSFVDGRARQREIRAGGE